MSQHSPQGFSMVVISTISPVVSGFSLLTSTGEIPLRLGMAGCPALTKYNVNGNFKIQHVIYVFCCLSDNRSICWNEASIRLDPWVTELTEYTANCNDQERRLCYFKLLSFGSCVLLQYNLSYPDKTSSPVFVSYVSASQYCIQPYQPQISSKLSGLCLHCFLFHALLSTIILTDFTSMFLTFSILYSPFLPSSPLQLSPLYLLASVQIIS